MKRSVSARLTNGLPLIEVDNQIKIFECRPSVGDLGGYFCAKHEDDSGNDNRADNNDLPAHTHTPFPGASNRPPAVFDTVTNFSKNFLLWQG